jgi:PAS domain S-box-containing protein
MACLDLAGPLGDELIWDFADEERNELAYGKLACGMARELGASAWAFVFADGGMNALAVSGRGSERADMRASAAPPRAGNWEGLLASLGIECRHVLALPLEIAGPLPQAVVLGRDDRPFDEVERQAAVALMRDIAPVATVRYRASRVQRVRDEAENELRTSEAELRTFFEESRDMIYTANGEDIVASINSAGIALLGQRDRFDIVGTPYSNFVLTPSDRGNFLERITKAGYVTDFEIILKKVGADPIFCLETAHAIKSPSGKILQIQGIVKDISERVSREREMWQLSVELADTNARLKETQMLMVQHEKLASIGQLAAGIAHEINNPLSFIVSNHSVLGQYMATFERAWKTAVASDPTLADRIEGELGLVELFAEVDSILRESNEGLSRIMNIVKNLKIFAHSGADSSMGSYDINNGIDSTLVVARNEIKYVADVELRLGDVPAIEAVGGEVNQVFLNILVNAAQAIAGQNRKERGRIVITTSQVDETVVCEISDDGPGVPEELRHRIFDPFFTTKGVGQGTGLGLSISYDIIVKKHGGSLMVDRSQAGGALFRIGLPIHHPPADDKEQRGNKADTDAGAIG